MFKSIITRLFGKGDERVTMYVPQDDNATFILKVDNIALGILKSENGQWIFKYTDEFKMHQNEYTHIIGFPDLNKEYRCDTLWPFFRIRIPGLKQPAVQEIIKNENIDQDNEVALLKRFGRKTISNPYELLVT